VAVFVDREWAAVGRNEFMPAPVCARMLEENGIAVTRLNAEQLCDATKLDATNLPVLVMPYGRAFPAKALPALLQFRKAGGCLITHDAPFTEAAEKLDGKWTTKHAKDVWAHIPGSLATGGLIGHADGERVATANPLGITQEMIESSYRYQSRLEAKTFPKEDEIIPIVSVASTNGISKPIAAAIKHHCRDAGDACDVWIGQTAWDLNGRERWFAEQLIVRGALWCLKEKGKLGAEEFQKHLAAIAAKPKPPAVPDKVAIRHTPRPWGDSLAPKSVPPAKRLKVVNLAPLKVEERAALCCLQGLTARTQPSIWLLRSNDTNQSDRVWLDEHVSSGAVEGYDIVTNWPSLFVAHTNKIKGAVIADKSMHRGEVIAMNVAACEDLILCSPELAERLHLPVKMDLRGRFKSYLEGMNWVWQTYRDRFCHHALDYFYPARLSWANADQPYQWRIPMVWTSFHQDAYEPQADPALEYDFVANILAAMDTHGIVMGWPSFGPMTGVDEYIAVMQATPYGHGYVCTDGIANRSVMSGVRVPPPPQPPQIPPPVLDTNKIYLAFVISDGDNLSAWQQYFEENYFSADTPAIPFGMTVGPSLFEIMPVIAQKVFKHARTNTEFICAVSGASYISPEVFASRLSDPEAAWKIFFDDTRRAMTTLGMKTLNISPRGEPFTSRYADALPFCHSIIVSWGRRSDNVSDLATNLPSGMPVFWSGTGGLKFDTPAAKDGGKDMVRAFYADLEELTAKQKPLLLCDISSCWEWKRSAMRELAVQKPDNVIFVTPSQLAALFKSKGTGP
jgi:hypothetical protein